ncbi:hypothetical protein [Aquabacterium sp.]|uniref:hypothetical protein n=1 Tax=Aquabacterium sp. TaxID=1872578 RepID=UPI003D6C8DF8
MTNVPQSVLNEIWNNKSDGRGHNRHSDAVRDQLTVVIDGETEGRVFERKIGGLVWVETTQGSSRSAFE